MTAAPLSRHELLLGAALAAGAAAAGPLVARALAQSGRIDIQVTQFALRLEGLEARYYRDGLARVPELSPTVRRVVRELARSETEHVHALERLVRQLGGNAVPPPRLDFGGAYASESRFLRVAQSLEDTGVAAYNGALPLIEQRDILATAASIAQVEARHAAAVRLLRGDPIAPSAFDEGLERRRALARLERLASAL